MAERTVADVLVESLLDWGVDTVGPNGPLPERGNVQPEPSRAALTLKAVLALGLLWVGGSALRSRR